MKHRRSFRQYPEYPAHPEDLVFPVSLEYLGNLENLVGLANLEYPEYLEFPEYLAFPAFPEYLARPGLHLCPTKHDYLQYQKQGHSYLLPERQDLVLRLIALSTCICQDPPE